MSKFFTKNNVNIPSIGLGTWDIRGKEGEKTIQLALDVGYRHIDTAQMYENEKEVGNAISDSKIKREEIFITTKIYTLIVKNDGIEDSFENKLLNSFTSLSVKFRPLRQKKVYQFETIIQGTGTNKLLRLNHSDSIKIIEEL